MSGREAGIGAACERTRAALEDLFVDGRIWGFRFRRAFGHLSSCEGCRAFHDRLTEVWRAMGREGEPPQIVAAREARAESLARSIGAAEPAGRPAIIRRALPFATTAAAAAVVLLGARSLLRPASMHGNSEGTFTERGGGEKGERSLGVRAFCLAAPRPDAPPDASAIVLGSAATTREGGPPIAELRCPLDGTLQLAYTLAPGPNVYLVVVGRDEHGMVRQYEPLPPATTSTPLSPGQRDEPLPQSIRLAVNHARGVVRMTALFTDRAVDAARLRDAIQAGHAPGADDGVLDAQVLDVRIE